MQSTRPRIGVKVAEVVTVEVGEYVSGCAVVVRVDVKEVVAEDVPELVGVLILHSTKLPSRYANTASLRSVAERSHSDWLVESLLPWTKPPARHERVPVRAPRFRPDTIFVFIALIRSAQLTSLLFGSMRIGDDTPLSE